MNLNISGLKPVMAVFAVAFACLFDTFSAKAGVDWAQFGRYEKANAELRAAADSLRPEIVFIGNSITEFWEKEHPDFFRSNNYVDRGIAGQTSYQTLVRFREDVINLKPRAVFINAGTNDIAENNHVYNEERTLGNIMSMAELASLNGIGVILTSVLPADRFYWNENITDVVEKVRSLNAKIKAYADANGLIYVDFHSALSDKNGALNPEYTPDGIHPNAKGYEVMEAVFERAYTEGIDTGKSHLQQQP